MHTNSPEAVFALLRARAHNGVLVKQKAESMAMQVCQYCRYNAVVARDLLEL